MELNLSARTALVTGATKGLGRHIAISLAKEGVNIILNGRNKTEVDSVIREIKSKSKVKAFACYADATKEKEINDFFSAAMPHIGRLDILVNNVGNLEKFGTLFNLDDRDWIRSFELTFMSMIRFSLRAYPWLKKSRHGRIVNIGSVPAHQPGQANPHYAAAKGAILTATKQMATEFAKDQILVNVVCPSTLDGGGWEKNIARRAKRDGITREKAEKLMRDEENSKSPLGRMGTLQDVTNLVAFLASDRAGFITGQCINVDGGITRSIL